MTKKLSVTQTKVLRHMAQGQKLHCAKHITPWLDGVEPDDEDIWLPPLRVHTNTWRSLLNRGCIVRDDADATPWWRRDYAITDVGRDLLQNTGSPVLEETNGAS